MERVVLVRETSEAMADEAMANRLAAARQQHVVTMLQQMRQVTSEEERVRVELAAARLSQKRLQAMRQQLEGPEPDLNA